ncbi:SPOR domain-containing protein [Pusillimonas sp.]|uniref:SPOR domain-containing protein n=1 Tax=Pusillimonas sp. TaxID=3040095 RepID=UPI0037C882CB
MGLFSRKEADSSKDRASSSKRRSASPSVAYADDLRGRARRRLIGALALVVAAVIVVPELITSESDQPVETPIVVPAIPPIPEPSIAVNEPLSEGQAGVDDQFNVETPALPLPEPVAPDDGPVQASGDTDQSAAPTKPEAKPEPAPKPEPDSKPASPPETKSAAADRTDDGSVAIALLEGRQPDSPPAAATRGNFVVQIAAYSSRQDAEARRNSLVSAGVTNAYVESANPDGKTTYRLRVGPFSTREAAQAAQTRLRSLDYTTSFIATQ